jgi:hypothetical protein
LLSSLWRWCLFFAWTIGDVSSLASWHSLQSIQFHVGHMKNNSPSWDPPQIFCKIASHPNTYTESNLAPFMTWIQVSKWKRKKERLPDRSTFNPCPSHTLKISISPLL